MKRVGSQVKIGNRRVTMRANGTTPIERWYLLARKNAAIIARRQKRMPRCKWCFTMHLRRGDLQCTPRFGCGGCTEMETFMDECRAFFAGWKRNGGGGNGR